jgi:uncharacterized membrane protein (DUF485 family)
VNEKRREFSDLVRAAEKLILPWKVALIVSNALWVLLAAFAVLGWLYE